MRGRVRGPSLRSQRGATIVEYALMVALIAVVCIAVFNALGAGSSVQFKTSDDQQGQSKSAPTGEPAISAASIGATAEVFDGMPFILQVGKGAEWSKESVENLLISSRSTTADSSENIAKIVPIKDGAANVSILVGKVTVASAKVNKGAASEGLKDIAKQMDKWAAAQK